MKIYTVFKTNMCITGQTILIGPHALKPVTFIPKPDLTEEEVLEVVAVQAKYVVCIISDPFLSKKVEVITFTNGKREKTDSQLLLGYHESVFSKKG